MAESIRCSRCHYANTPGAAFCGNCGATLPAIPPPPETTTEECAFCGSRNPVGATFCGECGRALAASPTEPAAPAVYPPAIPPAAAGRDGRWWPLLLLLAAGLVFLLAAGAFFVLPRLQPDSGATTVSSGGDTGGGENAGDDENSGGGEIDPAEGGSDRGTEVGEIPVVKETATATAPPSPTATVTATPTVSPSPTMSPSPTPAAGEFIIDATAPRTFTGIQVAAGQTVTVEFLSGEWRAGPAPTWPMVGPNGDAQVPSKPAFPSPLSPVMTLIAGVGAGRAVPVGTGATFTSDVAGELWLGPNDDDPTDNAGEMRVRVRLGEVEPVTIIPLEGSGLMQLTFGPERDYTPTLSPDQTRLVMSSEIDGTWTLVGVDVNGSGALTPLADDSSDYQAPHFSPDGQTLLVSGSLFGGDYNIYLLNSSGELMAPLTDMPGDEYSPRWLADGSGFVFSWQQDDVEGITLQRMDGERTELSRSTTFDGFAWPSPDGRRVAFYSGRDGNYEIYVMDIDGGSPRRLTVNPGRDASPTWSPDGQWIAFESDRNGTYDLFVMRPDGGEVRQITSGPANDYFPYFSPDGLWLLFQSDRTGNMDIFRMPFEL